MVVSPCKGPLTQLKSSAIDDCNENKVSWYQNSSVTYLKTKNSLWICCTKN